MPSSRPAHRIVLTLPAVLILFACQTTDRAMTGEPMTAATATQTVTGTFDVKLAPEPVSAKGQEASLGRMSLDKRFHGPLDAVSSGEMIMVRTAIAESAGYVALEKVTGSLDGKKGSFVLQHSGTMDRGTGSLSVTVVPDSGTADLTGLTGSMQIDIDAAGHHYRFTYSLPGTE